MTKTKEGPCRLHNVKSGPLHLPLFQQITRQPPGEGVPGRRALNLAACDVLERGVRDCKPSGRRKP